MVVDLVDLGLDAADDLFGVASGGHHDDAADRLGVAALDHRAVANLFADAYLGHVADVDGRARVFLEHDVANVVDAVDQADAADQVLLGVLRQDAAAGVVVVLLEGVVNIGDGQAEVAQLLRIDERLVLLDVAAG